MSDMEQALRLMNYRERCHSLHVSVFNYLKQPTAEEAAIIKMRYAKLKEDIKSDAHYVNLIKNRDGSNFYRNTFSKNIFAASAFGFTVKINSSVNLAMARSVEEAYYRLGKEEFAEWEKLIKKED